MNEAKLVSQNIKYYRKKAGLAQWQAAEKAGIKQPHWNRLETGRFLPNIPTLQKMCRAIGIDMVQLFEPTPEN